MIIAYSSKGDEKGHEKQPQRSEKEKKFELQKKYEINTLYKKLKKLMGEGMDKARKEFGLWVSKREAIYEDNIGADSIMKKSRGEFGKYIFNKYFAGKHPK